jgi:hypothetical protein
MRATEAHSANVICDPRRTDYCIQSSFFVFPVIKSHKVALCPRPFSDSRSSTQETDRLVRADPTDIDDHHTQSLNPSIVSYFHSLMPIPRAETLIIRRRTISWQSMDLDVLTASILRNIKEGNDPVRTIVKDRYK